MRFYELALKKDDTFAYTREAGSTPTATSLSCSRTKASTPRPSTTTSGRPPSTQPASRYTHHQQRGQQGAPSRKRTCPGCGSTAGHAARKECPAWGQKCHNCDLLNHYAKVCRQPKCSSASNSASNPPQHDSASAIIAHVEYRQSEDVFTSASPASEIRFVPAEMTPIIGGKRRPTHTIKIFPDSGADICLAGSKHLTELGIRPEDLTPCHKTVRAVGGSTLTCKGWVGIEFEVGGNTTHQPLYVCDRVDRIYFGRKGCKEVNILPRSFPFPMQTVASVEPALPSRKTSQS